MVLSIAYESKIADYTPPFRKCTKKVKMLKIQELLRKK